MFAHLPSIRTFHRNAHQPDIVNRGATVISNDSAEGREGHIRKQDLQTDRQIGIGTTNYRERRKRPADQHTTTISTT